MTTNEIDAAASLSLPSGADTGGEIQKAAATPNTALSEMEARKDAAYLERNQVVAALAKVFPSGVARTTIPGWSEDWHGCVYIDLPTGQVSWHFHDSQAYLFDGLPPYAGSWDGHDTPEKYRRLAALSALRAEEGSSVGLPPVPAQAAERLPAEVMELIARLLKRADEDQQCADNSAVVAEALASEMEKFEARTGHNVYAVRMAVDHRKSVKRDGGYATDLRRAAELLQTLRTQTERFAAADQSRPSSDEERKDEWDYRDAARDTIYGLKEGLKLAAEDELDRLYQKANADYIAAEERGDVIAQELHSAAAYWLANEGGKSADDRLIARTALRSGGEQQ